MAYRSPDFGPRTTATKPSKNGSGTKPTSSSDFDWGNTFTPPPPVLPPDFDWWALNPLPGPLDFDPQDVTTWPGYEPPSFDQILKDDPLYQAALANLNAESVSDRAQRDAAIRSSMIRFGIVPEGNYGFLGGDINSIIDPQTRAAAAQNTASGLSVWARLEAAAQEDKRNRVNTVGAHGMFRSGETGYQLKQAAQLASQNKFDSVNQLMDFLAGAQQGFLAAERQRQQLLWQLQSEAASRWKPKPPKYPVPPQQQPPAGSQTPAGAGQWPYGPTVPWQNPIAGVPAWPF